MRAFAQSTESHFCFEILDAKGAAIILMCISSVSGDEGVISALIDSLAVGVAKEIFFEVIDEDILCDVFDGVNIATDIFGTLGEIVFRSSMSDYLLPPCPIFCSNCPIVVAFDPEMEEPPSFHHFLINFCIVIKFFQVRDVTFDVIAAANTD